MKPQIPDRARGARAITREALPTLQELLLPIGWSLAQSEEPVQLNTKNPRYLPYLASVKRAIMLVWQYPDPALRHGLQGKLVLEFTILETGDLLKPRIVRSSRFPILDDEAIRSVRAASPFLPLPPELGKDRLTVAAGFEYVDNRLEYNLAARP